MPQNIDNTGLTLLVKSKQRGGKGCVEDAIKKKKSINSGSNFKEKGAL